MPFGFILSPMNQGRLEDLEIKSKDVAGSRRITEGPRVAHPVLMIYVRGEGL
jgi:hypothetical protein